MLPKLSVSLRYLPIPMLSNDRDEVVRVGYGVMPTPEEQDFENGEVEDPNVTYTQTLSPEEFAAYQKARFGDPDDPAGTSGNSCSGRALAQYPERPEPDRQGRFEVEFGDLVYAARFNGREVFHAEVEDPRVLRLDAEWGACMAKKGFGFEGLDSMHGPELAFFQAERTHPDGVVGPVHQEFIWTAEIPVEEKSLLGTESERTVAVADFDCRVETDYMSRYAQIQIALDNEFIAKHRAELDRLVAAAQEW
ncbi:MAG: hypothetical protein LBV06_08140 [Propionibacteriaceae bacterium]|nr:hypothetical protein [Propionibacteriaceae bacterium]